MRGKCRAGVSAHLWVTENHFTLPPVQKAKGEVKQWDQQVAAQWQLCFSVMLGCNLSVPSHSHSAIGISPPINLFPYASLRGKFAVWAQPGTFSCTLCPLSFLWKGCLGTESTEGNTSSWGICLHFILVGAEGKHHFILPSIRPFS